MSKVKITVSYENYEMAVARTTVRVDDKFAYQSAHAQSIEVEHLNKLIDLLDIENTVVEIK